MSLLQRKVIIVGAGLAGLSAAYELSKDDSYEIHLLESRKNIGGRVQSCIINKQYIDIGGFLVYPWYDRYIELIEELNLTKYLIHVPEVRDYFVASENTKDRYEEGFDFSFKELVQIFLSVFPNPLIDTDPTQPELHAYGDLSIKDYLKSLDLSPDKTRYYLRVFDTYLQGYCYGPVHQHKMAFMASTIFQNTVHGDVHSTFYLRNGNKVLLEAMEKVLRKRGVQFHLNCRYEKMQGKNLICSEGAIDTDHVIFCQTPAKVNYSQFITATVAYEGIATVNDDSEWGSCFYKEDASLACSVLSVVNLPKLYGKKTAQHLNINIKVNKVKNGKLSNTELLNIIRKEFKLRFRNISVLKMAHRVDWEKAMPLAKEKYVETIRNKQGKNNRYYAGDYLGCPSMETALMNGKRAADQLMQNANRG